MTAYKSTKEIAADVRTALKAALPAYTFSVRVKTFSGGASISLSVMSGPEQMIAGHAPQGREGRVPNLPFPGYAQLNQYQLLDERCSEMRLCNGVILTEAGWATMSKALEILSRDHWDKSDIQSDYYCTNFYIHLEVGKWDKDYQVKGAK